MGTAARAVVVAAGGDGPTDSMTGGETLGASTAFPGYAAVSEWLPVDREEVAKAVVPLLRDPVPSRLTPSKNEMAPVALAGVTVAVRVTL